MSESDSESFYSAVNEFLEDESSEVVASGKRTNAVNDFEVESKAANQHERMTVDLSTKTVFNSVGTSDNTKSVNDSEDNALKSVDRKGEEDDFVHDVEDTAVIEGNGTDSDGWDAWNDDVIGAVADERELVTSEFVDKERKESKNGSYWNWNEFTNAVAAVGESISEMVESSLGVPFPNDLVAEDHVSINSPLKENGSNSLPSYGNYLAEIGTNVVSGSLNVLESLGKKTYEKLTVVDTSSERRRFVFEPEKEQNLSEVLKEVRDTHGTHSVKSSDVDKLELQFTDYFERFGGLVHLEGLEMLSKSHLKMITGSKKEEMEEIFSSIQDGLIEECYTEENFCDELKRILHMIGLPYNGSGLIDCDQKWRFSAEGSMKKRFAAYLESLADFTAQSVSMVHKLGQLLLMVTVHVPNKPFEDLLIMLGRRISYRTFMSFNTPWEDALPNVVSTDYPENDSFSDEYTLSDFFLSANEAYSYIRRSVLLLRPLFIF